MNALGLVSILAIGVLAGCATDPCPSCDPPERSGTVESPDLIELSGIAASFRFEDVIYAHNDSGDTARFFALSSTGQHLATFDLEDGADNEDWEDIARAPCASGECLYIADIGDNELLRTSYTIYLVDEPKTVATGVLPFHRMQFTYPGNSHVNAEVLLVHPVTGEVTLVSKAESGPASIYELGTLSADDGKVAKKAGEVDPPDGRAKFTGGSIHADGTGVLLRTNTRLFHYPMKPEQTAAEALAGEPCQLELAEETQGEAVTWLRGGAGIMTIGELPADAPINVARCGG